MSLKNSFCSSPWFHMQITNQGQMRYCRFMDETKPHHAGDLGTRTIQRYFQEDMAPLRQILLDGGTPAPCASCHDMEAHGKLSGRQRQLLKVGVRVDEFAKTMRSSPFWQNFIDADAHQGEIDLMPQDWQIDLGNHCNSACVFCLPELSSRLAQDHLALGWIDQLPPSTWYQDPEKRESFFQALSQSRPRYLHFIGGETLITPAFRHMLRYLIQHDLHHDMTLGFTTNLTVWPQPVIDLLTNFRHINVGVSIECFTELNDYVRWPSRIDQVTSNLGKWQHLCLQQGWLMTLRVTPTALSIRDLHTVYYYAWHNNLSVQSCNFLIEPQALRITTLPKHLRDDIATDLEQRISRFGATTDQQMLNILSPAQSRDAAIQDAHSYIDYLRNAPDQSELMPQLVSRIKSLEGLRHNSILNYLPEYEEIFRSAGY